MKTKIILALALLHMLLCQSQTDTQIDSLYRVIKTTGSDSVRFVSYNKIAFHYIFNDTGKALKILKKAESLALRARSDYGYAKLVNTHGIYMDVIGKSDSAEFYFNKALALSREHKFAELESFCINNLGMFYWNRGDFKKALSYFFLALKRNEKFGAAQENIAINYNNIGLIYHQMGLFDKALVFHRKAYEIRKANGLKKEEVNSLNNIGLSYRSLGKLPLAISCFKKALAIADESKNFIGYFIALENLGESHLLMKDFDASIRYYTRALGSNKRVNESQKSRIYIFSGLGEAYLQKNQPEMALVYLNKGLEVVRKYPNFRNFAADLFRNAGQAYYQQGNFNKGKQYTEQFIAIKDSIFSQNNANAIASLEVKYETEKKEHELAESRAIVAERELEIKNKNTQFLVLSIISLAIVLISYLLYSRQKLRNRQLKRENQLKEAMAEIEMQNHLQNQRLRISRDLHDNIGAQLTFIISSLDNLRLFEISTEKLHQKIQHISDFTIATIYELRDTIWAMNKNDITFDDLKTRITNFIDNAKSSRENIDFEFVICDGPDLSQTFSSIDGMNIYRIIQESVNNALKYARATSIKVAITQNGELLRIEVLDDGIGFDPGNADFGNGLNNMRKRAKELGATLNIVSSKASGTKIVLEKGGG